MPILFRLFLSVLTIVAFETSVLSASIAREDASASRQQLADANDIVMFNPRSLKYHIPSCTHAKRCTHCIRIKRSDAKSRGGIPCKVCGAGE